MELVSIIVPIYKVEEYLDRCVESLVNQTYSNLEIILVDDGSPDNCPKMCDEWAEKDARIKVVHKKNGGLSDARNAGLGNATGEYIAFVDSDDWVENTYIEYLYRALKENDSEMAACDVRIAYEGDTNDAVVDSYKSAVKMTAAEAMSTLAKGRQVRATAWNKLYKTELLDGEKFEVGKLHEDEFFTYRIIDKCNSISYIDIPLYNYFQRQASIMSTYSIKRLDVLEAYYRRLKLFEEKYHELYPQDKIMYCNSCINNYTAVLQSDIESKNDARILIKNYRKKIKFSFSELMTYSLKDRMRIVLSSSAFIDLFVKFKIRKAK